MYKHWRVIIKWIGFLHDFQAGDLIEYIGLIEAKWSKLKNTFKMPPQNRRKLTIDESLRVRKLFFDLLVINNGHLEYSPNWGFENQDPTIEPGQLVRMATPADMFCRHDEEISKEDHKQCQLTDTHRGLAQCCDESGPPRQIPKPRQCSHELYEQLLWNNF